MAPPVMDGLPCGFQWGLLDISALASSGDPCMLNCHEYKQIISYLFTAINVAGDSAIKATLLCCFLFGLDFF